MGFVASQRILAFALTVYLTVYIVNTIQLSVKQLWSDLGYWAIWLAAVCFIFSTVILTTKSVMETASNYELLSWKQK